MPKLSWRGLLFDKTKNILIITLKVGLKSYDLVIFCWATFGYWYSISVNVHMYNIKSYYWENWLIFITSIMVVVRVLYEKKRALTYDFLSLYTGWNHRWCLHGSFRFTDEKWTSPCARNREIVIKPLKRNYVFQNTTQTKTAIKAPDRNPFRYWIKWQKKKNSKKKKKRAKQRSLLFVN